MLSVIKMVPVLQASDLKAEEGAGRVSSTCVASCSLNLAIKQQDLHLIQIKERPLSAAWHKIDPFSVSACQVDVEAMRIKWQLVKLTTTTSLMSPPRTNTLIKAGETEKNRL